MPDYDFRGTLQFFTKKEGGKKTAIHTESGLKLTFEDAEPKFNCILFLDNLELVLPGEHTVADITFAGNQTSPNGLYAGMSFEIFDLTRLIGKGTIMELFEND